MSFLFLQWTPTITANVTAQRASKRKKSVGGAFDTTGFNLTNDLPTSALVVIATVDANKVYEFKVENICTTGGPTINSNGIVEQIVFACILPTLTADGTTVTVNVPLINTDITKVRYTLKKQVDSSTVATATEVRVADNASHTFTGLTAVTGYYVLVEFYATVGGIEVISSSINYMNAVCGGNVSAYQITTTTVTSTCRMYQNVTSFPVISVAYYDCDDISHTGVTVNPGASICVDTGYGIPAGLTRVANACV